MSSAITSDYDLLIPLWSAWLSQEEWQPLDRWLRSQHNPTTRSVGGGHVSRSAHPLEKGTAMRAAMRYLQLACALEDAYRAQDENISYSEWDQQWQRSDVEKISRPAFWYWIALRAADDEKLNAPAPRSLRDAHNRHLFFQQWKKDITGDVENARYWLWQGLRPQWKHLLEARKVTNAWTDDQYQKFIALQTNTPPLWLRIQSEKSADMVQESLKKEGVNVELFDAGIAAFGGKNIVNTELYRNGEIEIQDIASQAIAAAVDVKPGQKVWDCCAGAGGKTMAIAARMQNKGMVLATDLHEFKLDEIKRRAKRARFYNVRTFPWHGDAALKLPQEVARQAGFDWVLVDAPCSSSGTWRRNPDARWHFSGTSLASLHSLQQQLLQNASIGVRVNGYLVYATCSWCVSENEEQVKLFLENNPAFHLVTQKLEGAPALDGDTMFVAVMQKS